jgi:UDP-N-acetylglucosamine diphosphorylase/glucosamine-1-phosphate N-acetyltransferase
VRDVARRMFAEALFYDRNVVLFEDGDTSVDLFPLAVLRPSWEIRCGAGCTREWIAGLLEPDRQVLLRPRAILEALAGLMAGHPDEPYDANLETLFVNGRVISANFEDQPVELPETLVDKDGRVLLARRSGSQAQQLLNLSGNEIAQILVKQGGAGARGCPGLSITSAWYSWDYMVNNTAILERQLNADRRAVPELLGAHMARELPVGVHLTDRTSGFPVYLGASVKLHPAAVLGNHAGPVWIGSHSEIEPHTYLAGPIYVGSHCRVKAGARLYPGTAIGNHSRVAGEVSQSVFEDYVNKQHDGFVGNSHLASWVNLGADTCTSNLRNDYGEVKVRVGDRLVPTGEKFIGLLAGDHVKTGINTMFNTGTVAGVGANIYGAGYPPRFVGSFQWGGAEEMKLGSLDRILETARVVMSRRGKELTAAEEQVIRKHYAEMTTEEKKS